MNLILFLQVKKTNEGLVKPVRFFRHTRKIYNFDHSRNLQSRNRKNGRPTTVTGIVRRLDGSLIIRETVLLVSSAVFRLIREERQTRSTQSSNTAGTADNVKSKKGKRQVNRDRSRTPFEG